MDQNTYTKLVTQLNTLIEPITEKSYAYSSLLEKIGDARIVLMGEATHGTEEFYQTRIALSKILIEKKGFGAIAIEGDWPDTYSIHRYIQGKGDLSHVETALEHFKRFPAWMWRNTTIPPFIKWLRNFNDVLKHNEQKIGFYGLDLYSLNTSMQAVINFLSNRDPNAAQLALKRYACFDHLNVDPSDYGFLTTYGLKELCNNEVLEQLIELQANAYKYLKEDGIAAKDEYFYACQNARVVKNAENYYRSMFQGHIDSWNARDTHMFETLNHLIEHLDKRNGKPSKIIIWAHNSHIGDASSTEMGDRGEINIGQLVKVQYDKKSYAIGFSTYAGTVTAASEWGGKAETKILNPALEGSYEAVFHQLKYKDFILHMENQTELHHFLAVPRLQRAVGVTYHPDTELESHYFLARLNSQFNSILHYDTTTALTPLDKTDLTQI